MQWIFGNSYMTPTTSIGRQPHKSGENNQNPKLTPTKVARFVGSFRESEEGEEEGK